MPSRTAASLVTAESRETLRLSTPVVLWWVWVAFVTANVADYAIQGLPSARFGAVISAILLLGTGLAYTLALRPRVLVDSSGLTVVNPFRVHHVPWRLIQQVGTGEWVRVQCADGKKLDCWALYVSSRAKRKIARGAARPRRGLFTSPRTAQWLEGDSAGPGHGTGPGYGRPSRLPEEARRLASLPVAQAMAERLDSRAARERAREARPGPGGASDGNNGGVAGSTEAVRAAASWSWPAIAAAAVPVLILVIVAVAA